MQKDLPTRGGGPLRRPGETRALVLRLAKEAIERDGSFSARAIGAELGISTQAVYLHLARLRESGELEAVR